jgi:hypothetical protein
VGYRLVRLAHAFYGRGEDSVCSGVFEPVPGKLASRPIFFFSRLRCAGTALSAPAAARAHACKSDVPESEGVCA